MGEITFWRDRNAALSALYEQLSMAHVRSILALMERAEVNGLSGWTGSSQAPCRC